MTGLSEALGGELDQPDEEVETAILDSEVKLMTAYDHMKTGFNTFDEFAYF